MSGFYMRCNTELKWVKAFQKTSLPTASASASKTC